MTKIKEIEVTYTPKEEKDPMRKTPTVCVKFKTSKGVYGDFLELTENAAIEDVILAVNALLTNVRNMNI